MLRQQNVCEQRGDVCARDKFSLFVEEHRAIRVRVPRHAKRRALFTDEFLSLRAIARQHRIRRTFGKRAIGFEVQRNQVQSQLLREPPSRSTHVTKIRVAYKRELLDHTAIDELQDMREIVVEYVALGAS